MSWVPREGPGAGLRAATGALAWAWGLVAAEDLPSSEGLISECFALGDDFFCIGCSLIGARNWVEVDGWAEVEG